MTEQGAIGLRSIGEPQPAMIQPSGVGASPLTRKLTSSPGRDIAITVLVLVVFAALSYGNGVAMPFVGDDYVFLDRTSWASFAQLWSPDSPAFRWYRPWSREVHFWIVQHVADGDPRAFRLAGLALWLLSLQLYRLFLNKIIAPAASCVATIGAASLALWGTPLLWISGSQDLWMLALGMLFLLLVAEHRDGLAIPVLSLALLSKETAAVFPAIAFAYMVIIVRDRWPTILRRIAPSALLTAVWAALHPTLGIRLSAPLQHDRELLDRPSHIVIAGKNILASFNISSVPRPDSVRAEDIVLAALAAVTLSLGLVLARRLFPGPAAASHPDRWRALVFFAIWAILGWLPTHLPSIGWHAYYGSLGALGVWAGIAVVILARQTLSVLLVSAMVLLRAADAKTLSWDWGNEWYLRRAGSLLSSIERTLKEQHPTLPAHTRVYFGRIPNNIGLVAGSSAAIRVWYRDSTLTADFYSNYRPRHSGMPSGSDFFFRFDTVTVLKEVLVGPEKVEAAVRNNPEWVEDHTKLAMLFLSSGQPSLAADQFQKIALLPGHPRAILFAGACRDLAGDRSRADSLYADYGRRAGLGADSVRSLASELRRSAPIPGNVHAR